MLKLPRIIFVLGCAPLLCGNFVRPSTEQQLTTRSDRVIVGRVEESGLPAPIGSPDKIKGGEVIIGTIISSPCSKVRVEKALKGAPAATVQVCRHRISELNPGPVQLGKEYKMFLTNAGPAYVPTSWDAFKELR